MRAASVLPARPARWRRAAPWVGAILVIVAIALGAFAWRERAVVREARAVRRAVAARRFDEAAAPLARWLSARPGSAEAHFYQARLHFAAGRLDDAARELDRAGELGFDPVAISRLRGFVLVLGGRYAEAEPYLVSARDRITRPDPELDEALARCFLQTYQLKAAGTMLRRWMREAPHDPRPHLWMVEIARRNETRPAEIVQLYREALRIDPNQDAARLGLAEALWGSERHAEAMTEYRAYIARHPDDPEGHLGAGRVALAIEDVTTATRDLDEALKLDPDHLSALRERAGLALRLRDYPKALELSERAVRLDPLDPGSLFRQGQALVHLGRADEARALQRRATRLREEIAALDELRFQLKQKPRDHDLRAQVADWFLDHGQEAEGLRWAQTTLSVEPDHAPTHRLLAEYYEKSGQPGLANFHRLHAGSDGPRP